MHAVIWVPQWKKVRLLFDDRSIMNCIHGQKMDYRYLIKQ